MTERRGKARLHRYKASIVWTGDRGTGTSSYKAYARDIEAHGEGKAPIAASSDPSFQGEFHALESRGAGDGGDLRLPPALVPLAAVAGVIVTAYEDDAEGVLAEEAGGDGQLEGVTLRPRVTISAGDPDVARKLHEPAHDKCFIARSVNFPITVEPTIVVAPAD